MPQNFLRGGNCPDAAPKLIFNIAMADAISADDRLARQAMEAFRRSQRPDGLINADAPTVKSNVIPAFSIYYLLMVHDHMMYLGDKALVKRHLPAIDGILGFFDRNLSEQGLVGKSGGPIMLAPRLPGNKYPAAGCHTKTVSNYCFSNFMFTGIFVSISVSYAKPAPSSIHL